MNKRPIVFDELTIWPIKTIKKQKQNKTTKKKQQKKLENILVYSGINIIHSCQIITVFPTVSVTYMYQCQNGFCIYSSSSFTGAKMLGRTAF